MQTFNPYTSDGRKHFAKNEQNEHTHQNVWNKEIIHLTKKTNKWKYCVNNNKNVNKLVKICGLIYVFSQMEYSIFGNKFIVRISLKLNSLLSVVCQFDICKKSSIPSLII